MKQILKSPIVHFFVIGSIIFFVYQTIKPKNKELIEVNQQTIDALVKAEQELSQQTITEERKKDIIANYLDEEVLLREAFKKGLQKKDFRVRKRLLTLMRSSITDMVPQPSMAQLRAYFDENKEKLIIAESRSFEMVKFSNSSQNIPANPETFLNTLENSDNPFQYSENVSFGNSALRNSYREIAGSFGREMAERVFKAEFNQWEGPLSTANSILYFRVIDEHEPYYPEFETIESYLQDEYYVTKARELQQEKIDNFRAKYTISIEQAQTE